MDVSVRQGATFLPFLVPFRPSKDWVMLAGIGEVTLTQSTNPDLPETPSQTHPEVMSYQLSGHP